VVYRGTVKNGVIELEGGTGLPDGTPVEIRPAVAGDGDGQAEPPLRKYARLARHTDLPSDFSEQHDHYIHGTPKR